MEFADYLRSKKIDPEIFKEQALDQYTEWKTMFDQVHPNSFTQQKLFLVNQVRRKYHLKETPKQQKSDAPKAARPKIKPLTPKTT